MAKSNQKELTEALESAHAALSIAIAHLGERTAPAIHAIRAQQRIREALRKAGSRLFAEGA